MQDEKSNDERQRPPLVTVSLRVYESLLVQISKWVFDQAADAEYADGYELAMHILEAQSDNIAAIAVGLLGPVPASLSGEQFEDLCHGLAEKIYNASQQLICEELERLAAALSPCAPPPRTCHKPRTKKEQPRDPPN